VPGVQCLKIALLCVEGTGVRALQPSGKWDSRFSRAAKRYSIIFCIFVFVSETDVFDFLKIKNAPNVITGLLLICWCSRVTHLLSVVISIRSHKKFQKKSLNYNTLDSMLHQTLYVRNKQFNSVVFQIGVGFI
jgi:hypothetical protein